MRFTQEKHLAYIIQALCKLFRVHAFIRPEQTYDSSYTLPTYHPGQTIHKYFGHSRALATPALLFKFITQLLSSKFIVTGNISQVINYVTPASHGVTLITLCQLQIEKFPGRVSRLFEVFWQNYSHSLSREVEGAFARLPTYHSLVSNEVTSCY